MRAIIVAFIVLLSAAPVSAKCFWFICWPPAHPVHHRPLIHHSHAAPRPKPDNHQIKTVIKKPIIKVKPKPPVVDNKPKPPAVDRTPIAPIK